MTELKVTFRKLSGTISVPPSKSHSIRAILCGSMAQGVSRVEGVLSSPDIEAAINACRQLGAVIEMQGTCLQIHGVGGCPQTPKKVIDAGNSGQVLRFIGALAALAEGYTVITGDQSIRTLRPIQPLIDGLQGLGAFAYTGRSEQCAPLVVKGPLRPGTTHLDGQDSQPVSALLLAAPFIEGTTTIHVQNPGELPWIGLTLSWLERLGVPYTVKSDAHYQVHGPHRYGGFNFRVPGDFSSAAYPAAAALLTNSAITIDNLDFTDSQGDKKVFDILTLMGARFERVQNGIKVLPNSRLKGCVIDLNEVIDAVTILAVIACFAEGETQLINGAIARRKECDRLSAISTELRKMGAIIRELPDGLVIQHSPLSGAQVHSYNDHRMAMSLAVAGLAANGETTVHGIEAAAKSYPGFANLWQGVA